MTGRHFDTTRLPDERDATAPDGSDVRILLRLGRGGMAHFELGAGRTSRAVAWYLGQLSLLRRQREAGSAGQGPVTAPIAERFRNTPRYQ